MQHYSGSVEAIPAGLTASEISDFEQLIRIAVSIFGVSPTGPEFCSFGLALFYSTFIPERVDMLYQLTEKKPAGDVKSLAILAHFNGITTLIQAFDTTLCNLASKGQVTLVGMHDEKVVGCIDDYELSDLYRWNLGH